MSANPRTDYRDKSMTTSRKAAVKSSWAAWLGFSLGLLVTQIFLAQVAFADWHRDEQSIMGTSVSAEIWLDDPAKAQALLADVMSEMRRIEQAFSPYIETSELSKLNRRAAIRPVRVSKEMWTLLNASRRVSDLSKGAFDITYASAGKLYDYREGERPVGAVLRGLQRRRPRWRRRPPVPS